MNESLTQNHAPSTQEAKATHYRRPHYNVSENEDAYNIEIHLPGVRKENVNLTLEKKELDITATRENNTPEGWNALRREISTADYKLRLHLNVEIDNEKIKAELEHGVLTLTLPKADSLKARKININ